jgi:hypothetical protein
MRLTLLPALLLLCGMTTLPLRADPLVDSLLRLTGFPEHNSTVFEQELRNVFPIIEGVVRYSADDLPDDVTDPFYWAFGGHGSVNINAYARQAAFTCNRLGRGGYSIAKRAVDVWAPIEGRPDVFGLWPFPLEMFPNDAVARLDCTFFLNTEKKQIVDLERISRSFETRFEDVEIYIDDHNVSLFSSTNRRLVARGGITENHRRIERIILQQIGPDIDIHFTVWLLQTGS